MRLKIKESTITIPDALIEDENLDIDTTNAINILIEKGERVISKSKQESARKALKIKVSKTKEKIQNAINLLRLQGRTINPYRVAKISGVSYNTAKKYVKKDI